MKNEVALTKPHKSEDQSVFPRLIDLSTSNGKIKKQLCKVVFIMASSNYSEVHMSDGKYLLSKTLKSIEEKLNNRFLRVHHSYSVNIDHVLSFSKSERKLTLSSGVQIPVSRRKMAIANLLLA